MTRERTMTKKLVKSLWEKGGGDNHIMRGRSPYDHIPWGGGG